MNVALAQSSPLLGAKLSSTSIRLQFCVRAFFDTREEPNPPVSLQSQLLACRFFTWPFFKSYAERAYSLLKQKQEANGWGETGIQAPDPSCLEGLWPYKLCKIDYLGFAEGFSIPERLVSGPWTSEKADLLYVLVCFHGEIDWEGSMAGETARQGLHQAIQQGNERAVAALAVLLGVGNALSTDFVQAAVIDYGCDKQIVRHLLFNAQILRPKDGVDFHDQSLWNWAVQEEKKGNPTGDWLRDMLKKAESFSLNFYEKGRTDFTGTVSFPYSGPKFDPRTSFETGIVARELARELLTKLYTHYGRRITSGRSD
jgi:large subunit ribosomal protein L14e